MVGKRSIHCEIRLLIRVWKALEYFCGYERDTPKCIICICTKVGYAKSKESHEEKMALYPMPMR